MKLAMLVASHKSLSCVILDKTISASGAEWVRSAVPAGCARIEVRISSRESNFFVDTCRVLPPPAAYVVIVHDDDDFSGIETLIPLIDKARPDVIVPRLVKVYPSGASERAEWAADGLGTRVERIGAFMGGARPQTFLFAAYSPRTWDRWSAYVESRPMPALSLDFTLALFILMSAAPVVAPGYEYRFNMQNWTDRKTADESTEHWLRRDGWVVFGARDVWLIRLLDDLSLLGYLSQDVSPVELRTILGHVVQGQDGLQGGRLRLGRASAAISPRLRWTLVAFQNGDVKGAFHRDFGLGRVPPYVDPRAERVIASLVKDVLPSLASASTGSELDQVDYWRQWIGVLAAAVDDR
jgi:hypothetical protein